MRARDLAPIYWGPFTRIRKPENGCSRKKAAEKCDVTYFFFSLSLMCGVISLRFLLLLVFVRYKRGRSRDFLSEIASL